MKRLAWQPLPMVALLGVLAVLTLLGLWQLQRSEDKRQLLARHEERQATAPAPLRLLLSDAEPVYRRVRLQGHLDAEHSLLLDNRLRDGRPGVELLQPLQDQSSGLWVLVNRGWLPWPDRRQPPAFTTPEQPLELLAWVYVPSGPVFQLASDKPCSGWPCLINAVTAPALWHALGREGYAHELRLAPGPATYRVDWPVVVSGPDKHQGYAMQWFSMAAVVAGLYLYLGWRAGTADEQR